MDNCQFKKKLKSIFCVLLSFLAFSYLLSSFLLTYAIVWWYGGLEQHVMKRAFILCHCVFFLWSLVSNQVIFPLLFLKSLYCAVVWFCAVRCNVPVSQYMEGRSSMQCYKRFNKLDPSINKGYWTEVEDAVSNAPAQQLPHCVKSLQWKERYFRSVKVTEISKYFVSFFNIPAPHFVNCVARSS